MAITVVYEGNDPSALSAADAWLGKNYQGVTVFTGDASWSDYAGSVPWEINLWANSNTQIFWSIPLFAVTGNLQSAAAGSYDSYYTAAAKQIAASQPNGTIYIRPGWEFNGNWYPWSAQSDPASYVGAFQQFVNSYRSVSNRFQFVWTPNIGSSGMANVAAAYPGDSYVNIIGVDMYDDKTYQTDPVAEFNYFKTEPFGLNWLTQFAAQHGKGLAVPEWGVNADNAAAFIQLANQWFQQNKVVYQGYWDSNQVFAGKLSDGSMPDAGAAYLAAFGVVGPSITAGRGDPGITDAQTVSPFGAFAISDRTAGATEKVTITLTNTGGVATDANGALSGQGLTKTATGVYTLSGTTSAVTAELDALIFTPTAHEVAPGSSITTNFTLSVFDGAYTATNAGALVTVTAVDAPPTITGTGNPTTTDAQSVHPFASVTVSDPIIGSIETVTITLSNTAGVATDANGALSGQGLTKAGVGVYTLSGASAALTAELDALVFPPTAHQVAPGSSVPTNFGLSVSDGTYTATDTGLSVVATAIDAPPVITGTGNPTITDAQTANPFAAVTISDPTVGAVETVTITLSNTAGVATDANGSLSGQGLTKTAAGVYTLSGAAAALTAELDALVFTPTAHQVAPGSNITTNFGLSVSDGTYTATDTGLTVVATAVDSPPTITGSGNPSITDAQTANPFAAVTISDPTVGAVETVTITLTNSAGVATDANGSLSGQGLTKTAAGVYTLSGGAAALTAELDALVFSPTAHQVAPGSSVTTNFGLSVSDGTYTAADTGLSVVATAVDAPPTIAGTGDPDITDAQTVSPFAAVTITDPTVGAVETVTITLTNPAGVATDANGSLSGQGLTKTGAGVYTLSGAAAVLTAELDALIFTPTAHQVAPGSSVTTNFGLSVSDGTFTTTDTGASVTATAVDAPPVIVGTGDPDINDLQTVHPFAGVTIADPTVGAVETVTITLRNTAGVATDANGSLSGQGLTKIGVGVYALSGAAAALTAELDALVFTPTAHQVAPGSSVTTSFGLSVSDGTYTATDTGASVTTTALGKWIVSNGAVDIGATISGGESLVVYGGASGSDATLLGGKAVIYGSASAIMISSGGVERVASGGSDLGATVYAGGELAVASGGTATSTTLSGGEAFIYGHTNGGVVTSGGRELVSSGGVDSGGSVSSGGAVVVRAGATMNEAIGDGGRELVSSGGMASRTTVGQHGALDIYAGGVASATRVLNGGSEVITAGGVAFDTVVGGGGSAKIDAGGVMSGLSLSGGGKVIDDGAIVIARADRLKGQIAGSGTIAQTVSQDLVLSGVGSQFTGEAVISAGRIELAGRKALGTGSVLFVAGRHLETLQIDAANAPAIGGTFANTISGFKAANQAIDLRGIAFVSGATAKLSGSTLTLSDGGHAYKFTLAGVHASTFTVTSDGAGGTEISPHVAKFAQATAAIAHTGADMPTPISDGGSSSYSPLLNPLGTASGRR